MVDSIEESLGRYQARQIEVVRGIESIKAAGAEAAVRRRMARELDEVSHRLFRANLIRLVYEGTIQALTFVSLALFLWIGALEALHGRLTIGELVAFNALVLLGNAAVTTLMLLWDRLQQATVLLDRLSDVLEQEPEPAPGEAVIAVEAYSLNRGEIFLLDSPRDGWRPGQDVAGRVERAAADGSGPPAGARVVGLHNYWFGFEDTQYRALIVALDWMDPQTENLTFEQALDQVAPDYLLLDTRMRAFFDQSPDTRLDLEGWLQARQGRLVREVDDPTYGTMQVYAVTRP
jgi:ABC-type multidrug transport system fused ATPase/permease subunit